MKPYTEQSYYELLEVPPSATIEEIRAAYQRAVQLYDVDSVALYPVGDPARVEELRKLLVEAVEILSDPQLRARYDHGLGIGSAAGGASALAAIGGVRATVVQATAQAPHRRPELTVTASGAGQHAPIERREPAFAAPPAGGRSAMLEQQPYPPAAATEPGGAADSGHPIAPSPRPNIAGWQPLAPAVAAEPHAAQPQPQAARLIGSADEHLGASAGPTTRAAPPPRRPLENAPVLAQESAIADAESALAQVQAQIAQRGREPRPRALEVPADAVFNGELLRHVRKARGMTLQVLADRTRISTRHLENVEADRYDALPATVYLRGILMNIARELGLDPLRVSKGYLALIEKQATRK